MRSAPRGDTVTSTLHMYRGLLFPMTCFAAVIPFPPALFIFPSRSSYLLPASAFSLRSVLAISPTTQSLLPPAAPFTHPAPYKQPIPRNSWTHIHHRPCCIYISLCVYRTPSSARTTSHTSAYAYTHACTLRSIRQPKR